MLLSLLLLTCGSLIRKSYDNSEHPSLCIYPVVANMLRDLSHITYIQGQMTWISGGPYPRLEGRIGTELPKL